MSVSVPVLYINLDDAVQRRERLEREFKTHAISAQRLEAVRWTLLSAQEQALYHSVALNARQYHSPLVNGEKGCYASHIRAWQWLLSSDAPCMWYWKTMCN